MQASNEITSLEGVDQLTSLNVLHLRENQVQSLDGFSNKLQNLFYINLRLFDSCCLLLTFVPVKRVRVTVIITACGGRWTSRTDCRQFLNVGAAWRLRGSIKMDVIASQIFAFNTHAVLTERLRLKQRFYTHLLLYPLNLLIRGQLKMLSNPAERKNSLRRQGSLTSDTTLNYLHRRSSLIYLGKIEHFCYFSISRWWFARDMNVYETGEMRWAT